jgi:hypothetical protein
MMIRAKSGKLYRHLPLSIATRGKFDMPLFKEKLLFQENFAIMPSKRGFGFKNINSGVFPLGQ